MFLLFSFPCLKPERALIKSTKDSTSSVDFLDKTHCIDYEKMILAVIAAMTELLLPVPVDRKATKLL